MDKKMIGMLGTNLYAVKVLENPNEPLKSYPIVEIKRGSNYYNVDANDFISMAYSQAALLKNSNGHEFTITYKIDDEETSVRVFDFDYNEGVKAVYKDPNKKNDKEKDGLYHIEFDELMIKTIRTVKEVMSEYRKTL